MKFTVYRDEERNRFIIVDETDIILDTLEGLHQIQELTGYLLSIIGEGDSVRIERATLEALHET